MQDEGTQQAFLVVVAIWSLALSVRAIRAVFAGGTYHMAFWEGGMMFAGKTLSANAVKTKAVLAPVVALAAIGGLTKSLPEAWTILMVGTIVIFVNDFVRAEKTSDTEPTK